MTTLVALEAERSVLGAALLGLDPEVAVKLREILPSPLAFADAAHRHAYTAIAALLDRGVPVDTLTVRDEAVRLGVPHDLDLLADLSAEVPTTASVLAHAEIVRDHFLRRELARIGRETVARAEAREVAIDSAYAESVQSLVSAAAPTLAKGAETIGGHLSGVLEDLTERGDSLLDRGAVTTGLDDLDEYLGGLAPGRMVVLAARPKKGKTSFALHLAREAANHGPVYFVSREMGKDELVERLLCSEAGLHLKRRGHRYSDRDVTELMRASKRLADLPLWIDTETKTPGMLRLKLAAEIAHGRKPVLVVVDYLQLLRWPAKTESRNIEVGKMTGALKGDIAKDLDLPVLVLSQLSRASVENGKERPPVLSDLRDSGSIEQDADQIVMLHYAGAENGRDALAPWGPATRTELWIRGNRHGPGGKLDVFYDRATGIWRQLNRFDSQEAA